ncbi:MAG: hypothetical protein H7336_10155 [Bacteriovorax sp.]|nr:hypothetical protein [Bacteriovorax sp.]
MRLMDIVHIPIIALIQLGFTCLWNLKIRKRAFNRLNIWLIAGFGTLFNVWGLDVIQREFVVDSLGNMLVVSAGCWLVFVVATTAKYYAVYGWSKREFWLDYGGDLLAFLLSGTLIYFAT